MSRLVRHHLTRLASLSHPHPVTPPHPHIHYQSVNPFYSYIYSFVHPTLSLYSFFQYTSSSHPHHFTPSHTLTHQPQPVRLQRHPRAVLSRASDPPMTRVTSASAPSGSTCVPDGEDIRQWHLYRTGFRYSHCSFQLKVGVASSRCHSSTLIPTCTYHMYHIASLLHPARCYPPPS